MISINKCCVALNLSEECQLLPSRMSKPKYKLIILLIPFLEHMVTGKRTCDAPHCHFFSKRERKKELFHPNKTHIKSNLKMQAFRGFSILPTTTNDTCPGGGRAKEKNI